MTTKTGLSRSPTVLTILAAVGFPISLYLIFVATPLDAELGFTQKIFYFHVPCAWITYLAFFVGSGSGVAYLLRRSRRWDHLAHASIEVGTVFTTLVLVTGPLWARPAWGAYWVWDARLTTTFVLWLIEIAYLLLREFVEEPEKAARFCAVLGLLGALDVPVIHFSVVLWRGLHPEAVVLSQRGFASGLPADFLVALVVSLATFTVLFGVMLSLRYRVLRATEQVDYLRCGAG
ncbi:MAG TPA: cytochrome c biogenesis protein [Candidatus Latescibacteria bacterium]|nr:cytochrome c biogenesis protein [Candidatus Latescibacterota bacterium]